MRTAALRITVCNVLHGGMLMLPLFEFSRRLARKKRITCCLSCREKQHRDVGNRQPPGRAQRAANVAMAHGRLSWRIKYTLYSCSSILQWHLMLIRWLRKTKAMPGQVARCFPRMHQTRTRACFEWKTSNKGNVWESVNHLTRLSCCKSVAAWHVVFRSTESEFALRRAAISDQ